jgi:Thioredoxin like C-terminal domain
MPPTPELFPGGSWETPWIAGESGDGLEIPYEAGGAHATIEGTGHLSVHLDGSEAQTIAVEAPALYTLAEHPRHERHQLTVKPSSGLRIWSVSFSAGVP